MKKPLKNQLNSQRRNQTQFLFPIVSFKGDMFQSLGMRLSAVFSMDESGSAELSRVIGATYLNPWT